MKEVFEKGEVIESIRGNGDELVENIIWEGCESVVVEGMKGMRV